MAVKPRPIATIGDFGGPAPRDGSYRPRVTNGEGNEPRDGGYRPRLSGQDGYQPSDGG
jgi:hypothetical protein